MVPNTISERNSRVQVVDHSLIPSVDEATEMYTSAGGRITRECSFGIDPLANDLELVTQRDREFSDNHIFPDIFNNVGSGEGSLFKSAVLSFINTTINLTQLAHD